MDDQSNQDKNFQCIVCKIDIKDGSEASVQCECCGDWSHTKCTMARDVFRTLDKVQKDTPEKKVVTSGGVMYFCAPCLVDIKSTIELKRKAKTSALEDSESATVDVHGSRSDLMNKENNIENKAPASTPVNLVSTKKSSQVGSKSIKNMSEENDVVEPKVENAPICIHYRRGKCRYGISGKGCSFSHPRKCAKYCRYGYDKYRGCHGKCNLFHPIICRNSINYKKCYSEQCTFVHLMGTERPTNLFLKPNLSSLNPHGARNIFHGEYPVYSNPRTTMPRWRNNHGERGFVSSQQQNFFPPTESQDVKINELSAAIKCIQGCLDNLLKRENSFPLHQQMNYSLENQVNSYVPGNPPYPIPSANCNEAKN